MGLFNANWENDEGAMAEHLALTDVNMEVGVVGPTLEEKSRCSSQMTLDLPEHHHPSTRHGN